MWDFIESVGQDRKACKEAKKTGYHWVQYKITYPTKTTKVQCCVGAEKCDEYGCEWECDQTNPCMKNTKAAFAYVTRESRYSGKVCCDLTSECNGRHCNNACFYETKKQPKSTPSPQSWPCGSQISYRWLESSPKKWVCCHERKASSEIIAIDQCNKAWDRALRAAKEEADAQAAQACDKVPTDTHGEMSFKWVETNSAESTLDWVCCNGRVVCDWKLSGAYCRESCDDAMISPESVGVCRRNWRKNTHLWVIDTTDGSWRCCFGTEEGYNGTLCNKNWDKLANKFDGFADYESNV